MTDQTTADRIAQLEEQVKSLQQALLHHITDGTHGQVYANITEASLDRSVTISGNTIST